MSHIIPPKKRLIPLRPDNVTPPSRTPWGGRRISEHYKADALAPQTVGESWEISVEPSFPSVTMDGRPLAGIIAKDPIALLGEQTASHFAGLPLLVKLLDAQTALSVQIHPADDDPALGPGESGKPEAWYVLEAAPGAGFYLGMREGVDEAAVREAVSSESDVSRLLRFVPVEPGDFFRIDAGTPHAIGPGVLLLEPQRVLPGRRGLTYRYWDWNRRYDSAGAPDPAGNPRELHLERALAVTQWSAPPIAAQTFPWSVDSSARFERLVTAPAGGLGLSRLSGSGETSLPGCPTARGITVVDGSLTVDGITLSRGRSGLLPASSDARTVSLEAAHALLCTVGEPDRA